ncbi:zinc-binding protein A33-like [Sardina pilchardus]|uniref:zinc-binding protein A33-like n=1 Tax=Sardina pilchardus TaxID=27697 RepID=UPI002E11D8EC
MSKSRTAGGAEGSQRTPESEALCHLHGEKLHLFCQEDQQPVCLVCRDAETHNNHKLRPLCDVAFEYKCTLEDPKIFSGVLIDVAKHLFNLKFRVWEKMQCVAEYAPINLDPNTAHRSLILSEDLMSVQYSEQGQQLPDNPERFDEHQSVLGSEGYTSGIHCWDVEVGDNPHWELGVMLDSAKVKGEDEDEYSTSRWILYYANNEYGTEPLKPIKVKQKPKRIRVQLNMNKSRVSFIDPDNNTQLHTFTHRFWLWNDEKKVFPYFKTMSSLKILPMKDSVAVTVEQPS